MYKNTTRIGNSTLGSNSLINNTTCNNNVAIGLNSAQKIITGINNVAIGYLAGPNTDLNNCIAIGSNAIGTKSNSFTLGNSLITTLYCATSTITTISDARDKTDFQNLDAGLDFVSKLNPVRFTWNSRDGSKKDIKDVGFKAQDLLEVQESTGIIIPNLVDDNDTENLKVGSSLLIPVLVKAIQELNVKNDNLTNELNNLKSLLIKNGSISK